MHCIVPFSNSGRRQGISTGWDGTRLPLLARAARPPATSPSSQSCACGLCHSILKFGLACGRDTRLAWTGWTGAVLHSCTDDAPATPAAPAAPAAQLLCLLHRSFSLLELPVPSVPKAEAAGSRCPIPDPRSPPGLQFLPVLCAQKCQTQTLRFSPLGSLPLWVLRGSWPISHHPSISHPPSNSGTQAGCSIPNSAHLALHLSSISII